MIVEKIPSLALPRYHSSSTQIPSHVPLPKFCLILHFLCALILKAGICELVRIIDLKLLEPLHHPESIACLRVFVPIGHPDAACWEGKDGENIKAFVPWLLLKWEKLLPSGLQNCILNVRCKTYSRDPQGIWLRLRFLKLHLFLFFAISYAASSTFYPVSLLNTSLTHHFHLNPLHRVSPGRTQPKTGTQTPCLCVRGTGTSLAVRVGGHGAPGLYTAIPWRYCRFSARPLQ